MSGWFPGAPPDEPVAVKEDEEEQSKPAQKILTEREYKRMIELVRKYGAGTWAPVARELGVSTKTVKIYFKKGNSRKGWQPIEKVIEHEKKAARQRMAEKHLELQEVKQIVEINDAIVQAQAIESRAKEAQLVEVARGNAQKLLDSLLQLGEGAALLANRLGQELGTIASALEFRPHEALSLLRKYAWAIKDTTSAAHQSMEMERLLLGENNGSPRGLNMGDLDGMSIEEMHLEITQAASALDRAKITSGGHLEVLDGGKILDIPGTEGGDASVPFSGDER